MIAAGDWEAFVLFRLELFHINISPVQVSEEPRFEQPGK